MEVDLEEGLPEAIKVTVTGWSHIQELDYKQIPFKCRHCHGYGNFARYCKKKTEESSDKSKGEQWTSIQKNGHAKAVGKGSNKGNNSTKHGNEKRNPQAPDENPNPKGSSSPDPQKVDLITLVRLKILKLIEMEAKLPGLVPLKVAPPSPHMQI